MDAAQSLAALLARSLPALVAVSFLLAARLAWPRIVDRVRYSRIPVLNSAYHGKREDFVFHAAGVYEEGYRTMRGVVHRIVTPDGEHVVVPNSYLEELRQRPDDEVDVLTALEKVMENDSIQLFPSHHNTKVAVDVVRKELTRSLPRINAVLSRVVAETVAAEMPASTGGGDWAPVNVYQTLLRIVAIVSGHVFVGPDLCRRPEYLAAAIHYTTDVSQAVPAVKRWPRLVRPLAKYLDPQLAKVRAHRRRMQAFLAPVIAERRAARARRGGGDSTAAVPEDALQWMLDRADAAGITDTVELCNMQLVLTMAAIHTTTMTTAFILHDLAARPEVVEACRQEVKDVLAAGDGGLSTGALFRMKLVDSVMRESQRMHPPLLDAFRRYTLRPITLRDGTHIPAGCLLATPNRAVLMDAQLYPDPRTFDAYRFVRLRTDAAAPDPLAFRNREQYQFVSVTKENMTFGFGRHACPGRFFAANTIKMVLAHVLLAYDLGPVPAAAGDGPEPAGGLSGAVVSGSGVGPDPTREILFRRAARSACDERGVVPVMDRCGLDASGDDDAAAGIT